MDDIQKRALQFVKETPQNFDPWAEAMDAMRQKGK